MAQVTGTTPRQSEQSEQPEVKPVHDHGDEPALENPIVLRSLREGVVAAEFNAIGCRHTILCTEASAAQDAALTASAYLQSLDHAASRFRVDSELSTLNRAARDNDVTAVISPLLHRVLTTALRVARLTDGLVDPTVGAALEAAGYDRTLEEIQLRDTFATRSALVPGWSSLRLDRSSRLLSMPRGTVLDVGASAKALAADDLARMLGRDLPGGVLVNLGGDIAIGGDLPRSGWSVGVADAHGAQLQVVTTVGQALTTSSTRHRTWRTGAGLAHHIIDPVTGAVAEPVWAQVTVCAATAVQANAASTAAVVLGHRAPSWLAERGLPALLVPLDEARVPVLTCGWPAPTRPAHDESDQSRQSAESRAAR